MGESIGSSIFSDADKKEFSKRLREETKILKRWLDGRRFPYIEKALLGLEIEACLLDQDLCPNPINDHFIQVADSKKIVEELSKFNFELNVDPHYLDKDVFSKMHAEISGLWQQCTSTASKMNSRSLLTGIQPLIRLNHLQPDYMSEGVRYQALNEQVLSLRQGQAISIDIKGEDNLKLELDHVMIEAAATSIQVHIQANQEDIVRKYNASQIISAPCLAIAANSPYLFGKKLWEETRIPLFEQSVYTPCYRNKKGEDVGRVFFGNAYAKHSILELFIENLDGFEPLLPYLFGDKSDEESLHHLRLHNGTLWRWNRPILGLSNGEPHLRIEQRAMASGPSIIDIVANMALSVGLTHYFATCEKAPEESMTFTDCKNNFYQAAKYGLNAKIRWFGKEVYIDKLLIEELVPKAEKALRDLGVDAADIQFYLLEVIKGRALNGLNGSKWQQLFCDRYGKDFQAMSEVYLQRQESELAVYQWQV